MTGGFLDQLDAELGSLVRQGAHLDNPAHRHRARWAFQRALTIAALAIILAASLVAEFPASANGHTLLPVAAAISQTA